MVRIHDRPSILLVPAAGGALFALAWNGGGYLPADWGLLALLAVVPALAAALVRDRLRVAPLDVVFAGGLAAFAAWSALSALWAPAPEEPFLETERAVVYVAAAAALVLAAGRRAAAALAGGVLAGSTALAVYALATRLFPGYVGGAYDPSSGYQLAAPLGYWNALGILLAMGTLVALGVAAGVRGAAVRCASAAGLVPLAAALYFTFSRGSLLALAAGAGVGLALSTGRLRVGAVGAACALPAAAGVVLAAGSDALVRPGFSLAAAQADGRRLAWQLAALALLAAALVPALDRLEPHVRLPRRGRVAIAVALAGLAAAAAAGGLVRVGGPSGLLERGLASFRTSAPERQENLNARLLSVSGHGRSEYWRVAWRMAADDPLLGGGAGGFERRWLAERRSDLVVRDAHNLYLETLAETGAVGLVLLLAALAAPLAAAARAPRSPVVAATAAAYAAFLVHAAVDWDWEIPVVTLAALAYGGVPLACRREAPAPPLTAGRRAALVAALSPLVVVALVAHVGNRALAAAEAAAARGERIRAVALAGRAAAWAPWSDAARRVRGEAQLALGDRAAARASFRAGLELDPASWQLWLDLSVASDGAGARAALARARRLDPIDVRDLTDS